MLKRKGAKQVLLGFIWETMGCMTLVLAFLFAFFLPRFVGISVAVIGGAQVVIAFALLGIGAVRYYKDLTGGE